MAKRSVLMVLAAGILAFPAAVCAQSYGDGFGVGGVLLPSGASTVLATTRLGDALALEVGLGLNVYDDSGNSSSDLGVSAALKKFWSTENNFQPFVGGRVSLSHSSYDNGELMGKGDDTQFGFEGVLGGEYFVTRRLSIDGEVGVGMYFGSFTIGTGTRLAAFLYL
jgi:hypothetical protein